MPPETQNEIPITPPSNTSGAPSKISLQKYLWFVLIVVVLGGVAYVLSTFSSVKNFISVDLPYEGGIYLSLSPEGGDYTGIYRFDFETKDLEKYYTYPGMSNINPSFMDDGSMLISSNRQTDGIYNDSKDPAVLQIFKLTTTGKLEQLTNSLTYFKREPTLVSSLNGVVYSARPTKESVGYDLNAWNVYFSSGAQQEELLVSGAHPLVSPDEKFMLVLRADGIYRFEFKTRMATPVVTGDELLLGTNVTLDLSKDGKLLAIASPDEGRLYIAEITSWEPFSINLSRYMDNLYGFWPVFSPDGTAVAIEEVDWNEGSPLNPRLVVYSLVSEDREVLFDLNDFIQTRMFVDGWLEDNL